MKTGELIFLDTNVLVYGYQEESPFYACSREILRQGFKGTLSLCVSPQVLMEFHATVTNPKRVTVPSTVEESLTEIEKYLRSRNIQKIYPNEKTLTQTLGLIQTYAITRQEVYDAQLAGTLLSNQVSRIYTFNEEHFRRFTELTVLVP